MGHERRPFRTALSAHASGGGWSIVAFLVAMVLVVATAVLPAMHGWTHASQRAQQHVCGSESASPSGLTTVARGEGSDSQGHKSSSEHSESHDSDCSVCATLMLMKSAGFTGAWFGASSPIVAAAGWVELQRALSPVLVECVGPKSARGPPKI